MLIPQFSLRWLLGLTALCAGISLVLAAATRGDHWALGVSAALAGAVALAALYVAAFAGAWLISQAAAGIIGKRPAGQSPFATKTSSELILEATVAAPSAMTESSPPISG
jgi:hypothetical protein